MTPTFVQVFNESDAPGLADKLGAIVLALALQLAEDVAPPWRRTPVAMGTTLPNVNTIVFPFFFRKKSDVPGALGYHNNTGIFVFTDDTLANGGTLSSGPNSITVTASHENCEFDGDENANRWRDAPDGYDYAEELGDPVEGDAYTKGGISVSNFVLPAYFDPSPVVGARFDHMGTLERPFSMRPGGGGYLIRRAEGGKIDQIFAAHASRHGHDAAVRNVHALGYDKGGDRVVIVEFDVAYPEWKKVGKLAKAKAKRCSK